MEPVFIFKFKSFTLLTRSLVLMTTVLTFQNCSPFARHASEQRDLASTENHTFVETGGGGMTPVQDTKVVGVVNSENLLITMQNETGVKNLKTASIKNMITAQIGKVPDKGSAESVTAPMWLAVTTVAGEVCQQLITEEIALTTKRIFTGVNFGASLTSSAVVDDVIRRMARNFWSRNETPAEHDLIRGDLNQVFPPASASATQTNNSMLYLCTVMLASLDAQKQ